MQPATSNFLWLMDRMSTYIVHKPVYSSSVTDCARDDINSLSVCPSVRRWPMLLKQVPGARSRCLSLKQMGFDGSSILMPDAYVRPPAQLLKIIDAINCLYVRCLCMRAVFLLKSTADFSW